MYSISKIRSPQLVLRPINFSLTDGTPIPAPIDTPPDSPVEPWHQKLDTLRITRQNTGGPLSSHPVTPIGNDSSLTLNRRSSYNMLCQTSGVVPADAGDLHNARVPATPPHDEHQPNRSRQSSFASRFLRFRSISSLRSSLSKQGNDSNSSFHGDNPQDSYIADARDIPARGSNDLVTVPRGIKRPSSRNGLNDPHGNTSASQTQSLPRMMRKRSMDMLKSVRRKSGMFGSSDRQSVDVAELLREEEHREQLLAEEDRAAKADEARRIRREREMEAKRKRIAADLIRRNPAPKLRMSVQGSIFQLGPEFDAIEQKFSDDY